MAPFHEDIVWPRVISSGMGAVGDGDHEVEYWFWNGYQLLPAPPDAEERQLQRAAWERLVALKARERWQARLRRLKGWCLRVVHPVGALASRRPAAQPSRPSAPPPHR